MPRRHLEGILVDATPSGSSLFTSIPPARGHCLFATIPPALSPGDPAEIAVNLHKMKFVQLSRSYARSGHVIITTKQLMMTLIMMMPPHAPAAVSAPDDGDAEMWL